MRCLRVRVEGRILCARHAQIEDDNADLRRRIAERNERREREEEEQFQTVLAEYTRRHAAGETVDQLLVHLADQVELHQMTQFNRRRLIDGLARLIHDNVVPFIIIQENVRFAFAQILHQRVRAAEHAQPLAQIARDTQNVHRAYVSMQTNLGTEILLRQTVPDNPRTCQIILGSWIVCGFADDSIRNILRVYDDMQYWYTKSKCRHDDDFLYKRMLDGLWVLINTYDDSTRGELLRRLLQECHESVSMCCEGHLTRLVNVMVGFHEGFQPSIPWKAILGDKMGALRAQAIPREEKIQRATELMNDLQVPESERVVWIDALE